MPAAGYDIIIYLFNFNCVEGLICLAETKFTLSISGNCHISLYGHVLSFSRTRFHPVYIPVKIKYNKNKNKNGRAPEERTPQNLESHHRKILVLPARNVRSSYVFFPLTGYVFLERRWVHLTDERSISHLWRHTSTDCTLSCSKLGSIPSPSTLSLPTRVSTARRRKGWSRVSNTIFVKSVFNSWKSTEQCVSFFLVLSETDI